MLSLSGGLFLGWALGANDAANVFGTAVASRIITFRKAALLCGTFVIIGAVLEGESGIKTLSGLSNQTLNTLSITSLSAAITVTLMILLKLPISTSQSIIGAILGTGLSMGFVNWHALEKVVICWIATPISSIILSIITYIILGHILNSVSMSILTRDKILWTGLIVIGIYGSYALGANNVANVTGIFSGKLGLSNQELALLGGSSIALGVITFSKRMMSVVGGKIISLDAFTALVSVLSMAITVHIFAKIGVPVSTSQGIVGAIVGVGLMEGVNTLNYRVLRNIIAGWILTPTIAMILSSSAYALFCCPKLH